MPYVVLPLCKPKAIGLPERIAVGLPEMQLRFNIHPEIISVHIPKTAGSSFHAVLKAHYGWRLKHIQRAADIKVWSLGQPYTCNKPFVKAIHGHVRPHQNWKTYYPKAKWVCWLRDPASRIYSAYNHLKRTQNLGDRNQHLFKAVQPNFETFLTHPDFAHVTQIYGRFLGNFTPQDFGFIGRTEQFDHDLKAFATYIGAGSLTAHRINVGNTKADIPNQFTDEVKALLPSEYHIYHTFLKAFYP